MMHSKLPVPSVNSKPNVNNVKKRSDNQQGTSSAGILQLQASVGNRAVMQLLSTPQHESTSTSAGPVAQLMKEEDWFTPIGAIEEDSEAKAEFTKIQKALEDLNWELIEETDRGHCYTEINGEYVSQGYDFKTDDLGQELSVGYKKVVYYNSNAPLIDLMHEQDHVNQMEALANTRRKDNDDTKTPYKPTNWALSEGHIPDEYEGYPSLDSDIIEGAMSSFFSDEQLEKRENILKFVNNGIQHDMELSGLTSAENEVLEYHAYLRELARFAEFNFSSPKLEPIIKKIEAHKVEAKKYISYAGDSDVVNACNDVQSFDELEKIYADILKGSDDQEVDETTD